MLQENAIDQVESPYNDNGLDFGGLDQPTNALAQFNLNNIPDLQAQSDNDIPQLETPSIDPPTKKKSLADLERDYQASRQRIQNRNDYGAMVQASQSRGLFQASRLMEFDAQALGVDRYKAYGKDIYNRVGFNPFQDNEKVFNENTTIFNDYTRMLGQFMPLLGTGFTSGYKSIGSIFSKKDRFFDPDEESAKDFAKGNFIGMSNRSGIGGSTFSFLNNLTLQMSYTAGVGLSILAEEAALAALTAATEGGAAPLAAARSAKNWERFSSSISRGFDFKSIQSLFNGTKDLAQSLSRVENAKSFYTGVKSGMYSFGKGAVKFINPLSRTTDDVVELMRGSASVRNLSNTAKLKNSFGAFYRDMRDINLALSESKLEGGSAQIDKYNELVNNYIEDYGSYPTGKDLEKIYSQSLDNGYTTTALNFPVIFLTNRIVFDGLMKFRGFQSIDAASRIAEKGIGFKAGVGFFDDATTNLWKAATKPFTQPKTYIGKGLNYFKANVAEGIQENLQNITAAGVNNYYDGLYKDPTRGGIEYALGSAWHGIKKEVSGQGIETFLSGFLMGGMMSKATGLLTTTIPKAAYSLKDRVMKTNKVAEYTAKKNERRAQIIEELNNIYKDPLKYFNSTYESASIQKNTEDVMNQANDQGDAKTFQDAKDLKTFDAIYTALTKGTFQNLIDGFRETKKLSSDEISEFFKLNDPEKAQAKLDELIDRAESMQKRYEILEQRFPNPFRIDNLPKNSDAYKLQAIGYVAFESAKKTALFAEDSFNRALDRVNNIYNDLVSDPPLSNASSLDYNVLRNVNAIDSEIALLRQEVQNFVGTTKDEKKLLKQKEERLALLEDYRDKLENHLSGYKPVVSSKEDPAQIVLDVDAESTEKLEEAYRNYLRFLAKSKNDFYNDGKVTDSFNKLLDIYKLDQESKKINEVVNTLMNPEGFARLQMGLSVHFQKLYDNRQNDTEERIRQAERIQEVTDLVTTLMNKGIRLDKDELINLILQKKRPTKYFNVASDLEIEPGSSLYDEAEQILDTYLEITQNQQTPAATSPTIVGSSNQPSTPVTQQPTVTSKVLDGMPIELQNELIAAYDDHVSEYGSDASLEEFVQQSSKAKRIIEEYNRKQNNPAEELTPQNFKPENQVESILISNLAFDTAVRNGYTGTFPKYVDDVRTTIDKIKSIPDPSLVTRDVIKIVFDSSDAIKSLKNEGLIDQAVEAILNTYATFKKGSKSNIQEIPIEGNDVVSQVIDKLRPLYSNPLELRNELLAREDYLRRKQQEDISKAPVEEHEAIRKRYEVEIVNVREKVKPSATAYVDPETGEVYDRVSSLKGDYSGFDDGGASANRGTIIDYLLREFIAGKITTLSQLQIAYDNHSLKTKTDEFTKNMLSDLFNIFTEVKDSTKDFVIIADVPTLWGELKGGKYAGTIDLLAINKINGKVYIIDLKTSSRNRRDPNDRYYQTYKDGDTIQQSAYAELLRQRTGVEVENVNIFPIQLFKANGKFARAIINKDETTGKLTMPVTLDNSLFMRSAQQQFQESLNNNLQPGSEQNTVFDIEAKKAIADQLTPIEQNFTDGQGGRKMQPQFALKSTMELILSGDRTRTTRAKTDIQRMIKDYGLSKIEDLVGKVIRMTDKNGRTAYTEITKVVPFTQEYQDATWQQEGWDKSVTDKLVGQYPYAIEFKLVSVDTPTSSAEVIEQLKSNEKTDILEQENKTAISSVEAFQKVNKLLDQITNLKNLPDITQPKKNKITTQIIQMIIKDEITMDNAKLLIENKRLQLRNELTTKSFKKGDTVTLKSGRQGKVVKVKSGVSIDIELKDVTNIMQTIMEDNLKDEIISIDKNVVDTRKVEEVQQPITEKDKEVMTQSKGSLSDFTSDTTRLKQVAQDAALKAGTDNKTNLDNLINNLGCKK